ncbi:hypothetical protein DNTS_033359 [Danionella cerebrum]|uniref:Protein FAM219B n=1 Tax=Danionella cerebrum TaxID=2873325 RepID=A0A553QJR2_9TELE|nr:hypothetical protein DNTS_033359 [Danionella translucida]
MKLMKRINVAAEVLSGRETQQELDFSNSKEKNDTVIDGTRAVEKRGPYNIKKTPSSTQNTLQKQRDSSRKALQKRGLRSALHQMRHKPKTLKFNKGYTALSQTGEDSLISLDSDSDAELDCSSGYSSAEIHPELSRQLLKDGYHLDETPDDADLDLIPPQASSSSSFSCCSCCYVQ